MVNTSTIGCHLVTRKLLLSSRKKLISILPSFIRNNKLIVYIDDILIPSSSIEENLKTLKEILLILKQYSFELNYHKSLFLKTSIEYLGYIIFSTGISLSTRHTDAICNYPQPTKMIKLQRFYIYLFGIPFTVVTDCQALVYALTKANLNHRILRWTLKLQSYFFTVIH